MAMLPEFLEMWKQALSLGFIEASSKRTLKGTIWYKSRTAGTIWVIQWDSFKLRSGAPVRVPMGSDL